MKIDQPNRTNLKGKNMLKSTLVAGLLATVALAPAAHAQTFGGFPTVTKQEQDKKAAEAKKNEPTAEEEVVAKPTYVVVDSRARGRAINGQAAYTSIQAAINDVAWGGVIVVMPGDYHENIDLRKPVSIQGDRGPGSRVRIYPTDGTRPCLNYEPYSDSDHALISNVEFRTSNMTYDTVGYNTAYDPKVVNSDPLDQPCVAVKSGVFTMKETTVDGGTTHNGPMVSITGGTATFEKNTISGGTDGILVNQRHPLWDRTVLVDNIVTNNRFNGLHLTGVSTMMATGNQISENGQGISYNGEGSTRLVGNKILNNRGNGVFLGEDAKQVLIQLNQIWSNSADGIEVIQANGLIEDNNISGNGGMAINLEQAYGNIPKINNNEISENAREVLKGRN